MSCTGAADPPDFKVHLVQRLDSLIRCIQPTKESLDRRNGVQEYVRRIISRCFAPEQVGGAEHIFISSWRT
jgi:hypothetical protein